MVTPSSACTGQNLKITLDLSFLHPVSANLRFVFIINPESHCFLHLCCDQNGPRHWHYHPSPGLLQQPPHCFCPVLLQSIFRIIDKRVPTKLAKPCHFFAQNPLIVSHLIHSKSQRFSDSPQCPTWSVCLSFRSHLFLFHPQPCSSLLAVRHASISWFCMYYSLLRKLILQRASWLTPWPFSCPEQCPAQNRYSINIYCWCWICQTIVPTKAQSFQNWERVCHFLQMYHKKVTNVLLLWDYTYPDSGAIVLDLNQFQASFFNNHLNTCGFCI